MTGRVSQKQSSSTREMEFPFIYLGPGAEVVKVTRLTSTYSRPLKQAPYLADADYLNTKTLYCFTSRSAHIIPGPPVCVAG